MRTFPIACARFSAALATAVIVAVVCPPAHGEPVPPAAASPQPAASAAPAVQHRIRFTVDSRTSYVNQQFVGPGTVPPEAGPFASGLPIAPGTPYDLWTSSPNVTGYGVNHTLLVTPSYALSPQLTLSATLGYGSITGNANVAAYWGDQPLATLNPHLGKRPAEVAFPAANGTDGYASAGSALLAVSLTRADRRFAARAGWFDLAQSEPFVLNQAAQTNTPIAFTEPLPETIGDGPEILSSFAPSRTRLPLYGVDVVARPRSDTTVEIADAELPEPPGTHARLLSASLNVARPGRLSFAFHAVRLVTGGAPIGTTIMFGSEPHVVNSDQGPLPTSTLAGQRMTIGGFRADVPVAPRVDAQLRVGMSCYSAQGVPGTRTGCARGSFTSARVARTVGDFQLALEALRMDATYAPAILPYGMLENVWSPAYSWPGTWLKGTYQLVEDAAMGPNRGGGRVTARFRVHGVETRLAYGVFDQLRPFDASTAYQQGFVEGFFLPQLASAGTRGTERHAALAVIAHPRIADVELDVTDVALSRAGSSGHPHERVAVDNRGATLTLWRRFGSHALASVGAGRNAMFGAFDAAGSPNVDLAERVVFGGLQWQQNPRFGYALQYRLYSVAGMATAGASGAPVSPAYHGPQLMLEQTTHF